MSERAARAASFGGVAAAYERARPGYPAEAVPWLVGERPSRVLDLGAGTGKLTRELVARGHRVLAVDPSEEMLAELRSAVAAPDAPEGAVVDARVGTAEAIPAADAEFDAVVVAQAFHWFNADVAVPEIARVLRPGGRLGAVWNVRDDSVPWVRELTAVISPGEASSVRLALPATSPFGPLDRATFRHTVALGRDGVLALALSRSYVAVQPPDRRARLLNAVGEIYDRHAGPDGLTLPYLTHCFRAERTE